ncbi:MAG: hypothetical protein A2026_22180 [Deltaproteobacteria bacterium RBG_19FT_COMBO_46_12]|nr:MAG: hypothetical protein A2026_22180 [Deltaproteobacteria bacterium RBG_19FT_COMBO_46_12]
MSPFLDLHSAELFGQLKDYSDEIPQPSWPDVLLWYPRFQREQFSQYFENVHCLDDGERFEV